MTPSMRLSDLARQWKDQKAFAAVADALNEAFSLGHEFGIERAADVVDQCNRDGPYNAIAAARQIRALKVERVNPVATQNEDFL